MILTIFAFFFSYSCQHSQTADEYFQKGAKYEIDGNFEEAIKYFDKALQIDSNFYEVWFNKGLTLTNLKKYDSAIECYDKSIK